MKRVRWAQAAGVLAALIACVGCQASSGDKSGGAGATEVLVLASNDGNMEGLSAVQLFADRIGELSDGRISVTIESEWAGGGDETRVITDVADGKADLGWSGTRAFDLKGVKSFQPLHAPFLIQSHDALNAVVQDQVAKDMLAALSPLGLTGLAVTADEFRMPAAAANPVRTPAEFHGLRVGTFGSEIQSEGLAALGAEPVRLSFPRPPEINTVDGVETSWTTYVATGQYETMPFITANAVLWPRSVALFANSERLAALDEDARGWIQQAANDATAWSLLHAGDREQDEMNRACAFGAKVVTAARRIWTRCARPPNRSTRDSGLIRSRPRRWRRSSLWSLGPQIPNLWRYRPDARTARGMRSASRCRTNRCPDPDRPATSPKACTDSSWIASA